MVKKVSIYLSQLLLNDEPDQFGNQGPIVVAQTKEERDAKDKAKRILVMCKLYGQTEIT